MTEVNSGMLPKPSEVRAIVDSASRDRIVGWAARQDVDSPLSLAIVIKGIVVGRGVANIFRKDLEQVGIGKGFHGFSINIEIPRELESESLVSVVDELSQEEVACFDRSANSTPSPVQAPVLSQDSAELIANGEAPLPRLVGALDYVEAGFAFGWAAWKEVDAPLEVAILADGREIGRGPANRHRGDLRASGIHEGNHGFAISLDVLPLEAKAATLTVVDVVTDRAIDGAVLRVNLPKDRLVVRIDRVSDGHLLGVVIGQAPLGSWQVCIYESDKLVGTAKGQTDGISGDFALRLPLRLIDGRRHLYVAGISGQPYCAGMATLSASPVTTPWQFLANSFEQPGFMSAPNAAGHRYEALHAHLKATAAGKGILTSEDLFTAHSVVVESYEGRTKFPRFNLPAVSRPRVSVIVPAYNKFELTYNCLASIALAYNRTPYEVIVADDCSDDETAKVEDIVGNVKVSRNSENLRFLRSCNQAAQMALGEYIIFLNNDTEVTPGWIDELVAAHDRDNLVGLTGSKLLNLDGTLQEAGGIVWGNGVPWNVGRGANPLAPEYNYVRQVDYLTGAAMCIRRSVFHEVGGFSDEFAPCYYEDVDIAFKVRAAGLKTVYVPSSRVIHFEGQSHGTDVRVGLKAYQRVNESKFRSKWIGAYRHNGSLGIDLEIKKDRNVDYRVLFIDHSTPDPSNDAGSYIVFETIKILTSLGIKVTFAGENLAHLGKLTCNLQNTGVEVLYAPFYTSMEDVISRRALEMDAVYLVNYHVAEKYVDLIRSASKARILFNNCDLHFLRELRVIAGANDPERLSAAAVIRQRELSLMQKVDVILSYNEVEHAVILSHLLKAQNVFKAPWVLHSKPEAAAFETRRGIAFLGGYGHFPNVEAVEYFAREVMPRLAKRRPDIVFNIYGSKMPKTFAELASDNVAPVGFVENLEDVYQKHRIFVAPLLSGAGIKGKVLESMSFGCPMVLTSVAAEATGLSDQVSALFAEDPEQWVAKILELYDNQTLWSRLSENSRIIAECKFSAANARSAYRKILSYANIYVETETDA